MFHSQGSVRRAGQGFVPFDKKPVKKASNYRKIVFTKKRDPVKEALIKKAEACAMERARKQEEAVKQSRAELEQDPFELQLLQMLDEVAVPKTVEEAWENIHAVTSNACCHGVPPKERMANFTIYSGCFYHPIDKHRVWLNIPRLTEVTKIGQSYKTFEVLYHKGFKRCDFKHDRRFLKEALAMKELRDGDWIGFEQP